MIYAHDIIAFGKRCGIYLTTMFPIQKNLPTAMVMFFGIDCFVSLGTQSPLLFDWTTINAIFSVFISLLLMRTFDELKDEEIDKLVFPNRPLVTGKVRYDDVRILCIVSLLLFTYINIGRGIVTDAAFVLIVFAILSWQWWLFSATVSNSFSLTFITHQPIVALLLTYIYCICVQRRGIDFDFAELLPIAIIFWLPFIAWEIGRKIRAPTQEDDYLSYTKRWGTRQAMLILIVLWLVGTSAVLLYSLTLSEITALFYWLYIGLTTVCVLVALIFIIKPVSQTNHMKTIAESYLFCFYLIPIIEWFAAT